MTKIKFKIATPERVIYESDVDQVTCPTQMGEITVLPDHIPLVANLVPGEMKIVENGLEKFLATSGGIVEVRPGNEVVILADAAEHPEEIDISRAEQAREKARKLMTEKTLGEEEFAATSAALERSLTRIKIAKKHRYKNVGKPPETVQ